SRPNTGPTSGTKLRSLLLQANSAPNDGGTASWPTAAPTLVPDPTATAIRACGASKPFVTVPENTRATEAAYAVSLVAALTLHAGLLKIRPGAVGYSARGSKRPERAAISGVSR